MSGINTDILTKFNEELIAIKPLFDNIINSKKDLNVFRILKINENENRISNFISWLLDPSEDHNLGFFFLKEFLDLIVPSNNYSNLNDTKIFREFGYIDIFIINENSKFVCVIENKILSGEHGKRLENYIKLVEKVYGTSFKINYIYLSLNSPTANGRYKNLFYRQLLDILDKIRPNLVDIIDEDLKKYVLRLVNQFKLNIEVNLMQSKELGDISNSILLTHLNTIDYFIEYRNKKKKEISNLIKNALNSFENDSENKIVVYEHYTKKVHHWFRFSTKNLSRILNGKTYTIKLIRKHVLKSN